MRSIVYGIVGIVIGVGLFIGGVASSGDDEVKCGGRTMSPGDTCRTVGNGSSTERSYEEQKSQNGREAVLMMIFGPVVAIGGLVFLAGSSLGRRRRVHHPTYQPAQPGYAPAQPGFAPAQPGYPPAQPPAQPGYPPAAHPGHAQPAYPPAPPAAQPGYPPAPQPAHPGYGYAPPASPPQPPGHYPPPGGHPPYRG
ncbi:hypothetical protein [Actinomadura chokoriensis]|uniref:hypothetical protein n=1 Tax=Actinomadura chokoriensis TaxID=454156 RepID=UPI0031FA1D1D